ncbi:MAG: hypothetical protein HC829_05595 [Bacteroidales bacterium]|nr:hypothetical protein [Bacteroidales bacterium]
MTEVEPARIAGEVETDHVSFSCYPRSAEGRSIGNSAEPGVRRNFRRRATPDKLADIRSNGSERGERQ